MSDFDTLIDQQIAQRKKSNLESSLTVGMNHNPDAYAKQRQIGNALGVAPAVVADNETAFEKAAKLKQFDFDKFIQTAPRTSTWAAEQDNAAISFDDLHNLAEIEANAQGLGGLTPAQRAAVIEERKRVYFHNKDRNEVESAGSAVNTGFYSPFINFGAYVTNRVDILSGILKTGLDIATGNIDPSSGASLIKRMFTGEIGTPSGLGQKALGVGEAANQWLASPQKTGPQQMLTADGKTFENPDYRWWGRPLTTSLESVPGAIAGFMVGGQMGPKVMPTLMATNAAEEKFRQAIHEGADLPTAITEGFGSGLLNYGLMTKLPAPVKADTIAGAVAQTLGRGATLGLGMTYGENILARQHDPDRPLFEGAMPNVMSMIAFESAGSFMRVIEIAKESKLRARDQEKFREYLDRVFEGQDSIRVPVEQFDVYFQSKNLDPSQVAENIGAKNYLEAKASGTDVEIPASDYIGKMDYEHQKGLIGDIVIPSIGKTTKQAIEAQQQLEKWLADGGAEKLAADIQKVDAETQASEEYQSVKTQLRQQYEAAGETPEVAESYATLQANVYSNLARETGMKPSELMGLYRPVMKVSDTIPDVSLKQGAGDKSTQPIDRTPAGVSEEQSAAYADAIQRGDKRKALKILHEALAISEKDWSIDRGGAHDAPSPGDGGGSPLYDVSRDGTYPEDVYGPNALRYYGTGSELDGEALSIIKSYEGHPNKPITVYRSVEKSGPNKIAAGDWVTTVRKYAKEHGDSALNGDYKILKATVYARDLFTAGDSWLEFGYHPQEFKPEIPKGEAKNTPLQHRVEKLRADATDTTTPPSEAGTLRQENRGWFRVLPDGSFEIGKTKIGDLSTFVHEPAHSYLFLISDLAKREGASENLKGDYQKILDYLGAKEGEALTTEQHEKWARANEQYLREGKAPSPGLRGVFQRFAVWLSSIYKRASDLGVELSDDIRGVFDRMYAAEDGVNRAAKDSGPQLFSTPEEAGWTPEQFQAYADSKGMEVEQAKAEILAKMNEAAVRERSEAWREEEKTTREAVAVEIDRRPEYVALRSLQKGKLDDGTPLSLNRDELIKQFGKERTDALRKQHIGIYRNEGGVDAETAAEILGFNSGEEMIRALETAPRRSAAIDQATREYMTAKHGDIRYDGSLQDEAAIALENDKRAANLHRELQALQRRNNPEFELREAQREAKRLIKEQEADQKARDTKQTAKDMTSLANGLLKENAQQAAAIERRQQRIEQLQQKIAELEQQAKETAREQDAGNRFARAIPPIESFKEAAIAMVESKQLIDLQPQRYLDASRVAAREAHDFLAKGDYWGAKTAKQKELINHFLFREASKAKAEADKTLTQVQKYSKASVREKIAQAGGVQGQHVYLDQIDNILEQFRFKQETTKSIRERQTLQQFAAQKQAEAAAEFAALNPNWALDHPGEVPEIPQIVDTSIAGLSKNYRELTITELRAVRDALKNIETLARREWGILRDGKLVSFDQEVADFERISREKNKVKTVPRSGAKLTGKEWFMQQVHGMDASMQKMEWFINQLDGGDINGPARRNIKKPVDDAWGESLRMGDEIFTKLKALVEARPKEDVDSLLDSTGIQFPMSDRPLNRRQLISWALNLGTAENQKVALLGEGLIGADGSPSPLVKQALGTLRKSELEFVQGVWDILEGMRPAIEAKALRTTGIAPKLKKVTPFDVTSADGETVHMRGGYYPLKGEPGDRVGQKQIDPANIVTVGSQKPKTSTSHLQQVTGATYRLLLDYENVLSKHLADVISDTTKGEAISQVYKFISDDRVRSTIQETLGQPESVEFMEWLRDFAGNNRSGVGDNLPLVQWLMNRRSGMVVARLGGNLSSYLIQMGDVFKSIADPDIKTRYIAKAFLDIRRNPTELIEQIRALSPNEMRFREKNFNRDIKDMLESKSPFDLKKQKITEFLMDGFAIMDRLITFPAWLGRFRQGLAEHGDQARAVMEADRAIARDYMAGDNRNMSSIMRKGGLVRLMTTFQGDANTWYGIISGAVRSGNPRAVSVGIMALVAEQIVGQYIRNRGAKEDENYAGWAIEQALLAGLNLFPIAGDFGQLIVQKAMGQYATTSQPTMSALETVGKDVVDLFSDKKDAQEKAQALFEATGIYLGIPGTSQAIRTWRYIHKVQKGKEPEPKNAYEAVRGAVQGSNKKH